MFNLKIFIITTLRIKSTNSISRLLRNRPVTPTDHMLLPLQQAPSPSFFRKMTTFSNVPVHLIISKAQTSPTSKRLSTTKFLHPRENFTSVFATLHLTGQVLPAGTKRVAVLLFFSKCLLTNLNGIFCNRISQQRIPIF